MIKIYISIILYIFICKNVKKPKGSEGMHPQVLRNLSDVIARSLPIIFDQSRQLGEVTKDWRKANATPCKCFPFQEGQERGPREPAHTFQSHHNPWEGDRMAHLWKSFPKKDKKIIRSSHHSFTKAKSYLTNLQDKLVRLNN